MHPTLHKHLYTYFVPIVQNPLGVDLPAAQPFVVLAPGERYTLPVYLGRAFAYELEEIVMQVWEDGTGEFTIGNAGELPWSRLVYARIYAEGFEAPLELAQSVPVSMICPDPMRRGGNLQFNWMLPPRGVVTIDLHNRSSVALAVGGHLQGQAYRSDTP